MHTPTSKDGWRVEVIREGTPAEGAEAQRRALGIVVEWSRGRRRAKEGATTESGDLPARLVR